MGNNRIKPKQLRRLRRWLGLLPCEWCGRFDEAVPGMKWSELPLDDWVAHVKANPVHICRRPLCQQRHKESGGIHPKRHALGATPPPAERRSDEPRRHRAPARAAR